MKTHHHGIAGSKTHYEALCVREDATYPEIRAQYRSALITLHPDKNFCNASQISPSNAKGGLDPRGPIPPVGTENSDCPLVGSQEYVVLLNMHLVSTDCYANRQPGIQDEEFLQRFLRVQQAWEVLKDSKSRATYDNELFASRHSTDVFVDDIELEEMSIEHDGEGAVEYYCPCRCGDYFVVGRRELEEMGFKPGVRRGEELSNLPLHEILTEEMIPEATRGETTPRGQRNGEQQSRGNIERRFILLPCGSCSLKIRLFF